jgi:hypothetical protein
MKLPGALIIEERLREALGLGEAMQPARRRHQGGGAPTIQHSAEAISWLNWIDPEDAALVQARLQGAQWKAICFRFGISRPTAHRRWRHALGLIAWRLNGRDLPANCSRRRFRQLAACEM